MLVFNGLVDAVNLLIAQVSNTRRKKEFQPVKETEYFFRVSCCIGRMFKERKLRFVVEQPVQDIRSIAYRGGFGFASLLRVLAGRPRIER